MTDQPVLKTPGELLQEARQGSGLELDAMSERTKIPVAILRSLELDEYHKISGPLYVNSFLRTYATDLGLDPAGVLEAYLKFSGEVVDTGPAPDPEAVWVDEEVKISHVGVPWGIVASVAGVILILVLLVFWITHQTGCWVGDVNPSAGDDSPVAHESLLAEPQLMLPNQPVATTAPDSSEEVGGQSTPTEEPDPEDPSEVEAINATGDSDLPLQNSETEDRIETTPVAVPVNREDGDWPSAVSGDQDILFQDGRRWPVVLRLLCEDPVGTLVIRDGERQSSAVGWLDSDQVYPALPSVGVQHGQPYRTEEGLVVYWGARDQFSLKLDRTAGVEISLNGDIRNISDLLPHQEIILFETKSDRNNRR